MPPKFFITHSWKDIDFARRLCDDLRKHGLDGFFDAYSIRPGDMVPTEIARGLEACDIYVPVLSYAALKSPWCDEEINAAITLGKMPERNGRPRIIPILIENCQDKMSVFLLNRLYINFTNRYDDALIELLTKGIGVSVAASEVQRAARPTSQIISPARPSIQTLPRTKIGKDGRERVLIPAGEFLMGSDDGLDREKPVHKVYVDAFYMDRNLVTNAAYKAFMDATKHRAPGNWRKGKIPRGKENHPVVYVDWRDAAAYAKWTGARLPTEAEWEKAASWDDTKKVKRTYPWGDKFDQNLLNSSEGGKGDTTPVGSYPGSASPYGVLDMAGNVWEWCVDWYDENYYSNSPKLNPKGPDAGEYHILRGGSWFNDRAFACCAYRLKLGPGYHFDHFGFRVAESVST